MSGNTAHVLRGASNATWLVSKAINEVFPEGNLRSPSWAPGRLLKRRERAPMPTGIPRSTLSLCPDCNREAVEAVLKGEIDIANFRENPGVVEAEIVEEAGRILMRKSCKKHGPFEDALSNHPDFFRRMERLAFGRDFECVDDCNVHVHGPYFFFQAEDGIRDVAVTGVQTCAIPISGSSPRSAPAPRRSSSSGSR